jgi:hypothetical protein
MLRAVVNQFVLSDDLVDLTCCMINMEILAKHPYMPLEFIDFDRSSHTVRHYMMRCNKLIDDEFITNHSKFITLNDLFDRSFVDGNI